MTSLYTSIAPWYDRIFPVDPDTADFLAAGLRPGARVLDLACGTGGYAKALAARGNAVEACDLDAAMIDLAAAGSPGASFRVLDMREAPAFFAGSRFDLAFCIGNSLVHLPDGAAVAALLAGLRPLLSPAGSLILQVVNYDRILDGGIDELPAIRRPGLEFVRRLVVRDERLGDGEVRGRVPVGDRGHAPDPFADVGSVCFATTLTVGSGADHRVIRNETPLLPLRRATLERALLAAGYGDLRILGDFDGTPWSPDGHYAVMRACA